MKQTGPLCLEWLTWISQLYLTNNGFHWKIYAQMNFMVEKKCMYSGKYGNQVYQCFWISKPKLFPICHKDTATKQLHMMECARLEYVFCYTNSIVRTKEWFVTRLDLLAESIYTDISYKPVFLTYSRKVVNVSIY